MPAIFSEAAAVALVVITRHHKPRFVIMSVKHYEALLRKQQGIEALTRILDLLPHIAGLDITTSAGSARVSRDVPGNYPAGRPDSGRDVYAQS
ncbi:hypothetical protein [Komagataeibacter rhaeticus]|uniref:hypothetical protein n=1 Tax=Komagataeibacter rhaeticus TaxID=215221 RepID=UPI001A55080E|nr:hypothetical protein [Komagataeibacter rhaeticus]MBL7241336.1 type II toxin-antitoxin system Phd/YefM family antitoxin [Komagataeibacter rhaeticus]